MEIKFYSTHCPKCNVLKQKMQKKNVSFVEINDIDIIISKGFSSVPMLEVDDKVMGFVEANNFVNSL